MQISKPLRIPGAADLIRHIFLAWLIATATEALLLSSQMRDLSQLTGLGAMSFPRLLLVTAGITGLLSAAGLFFPIGVYERWGIVAAFCLLAVVSLTASFSWAFLGICALVTAILVVYALWGRDDKAALTVSTKKVHWGFLVGVAVLAAAFFAAVCAWTVGRYNSYSTPNFDFGIFCQMFHNMKETGLPMTTVERDGLLSHFAVHVSPIYYLMLPFYWLFPTPQTLQVLQAAILASAVIPLWLIGKQHGLSGPVRMLLCALVLVLPTTAGGTSYDLHENCFLLPLILWLLYAIDRRSTWLTALFGVLTLCVKEDAAVYVAIAAIYLLLRALLGGKEHRCKDLITGGALLAGAVVWFLLVTGYLATHGDGVMTSRYRNFMYDGSKSLITVIKAVLLSPMKMLFECVDGEKKLLYILRTMAPLMALPLLTRKYERYVLVIPYVLLNLMSDYQYQHDIFFQYGFGSSAFLIYLTAVNLADFGKELPRLAAGVVAVAVSFGFFSHLITPKITYYSELYSKHAAYYDGVTQSLATIPEGASVTAHTFYIPRLYQRSVLYELRYCSRENLLDTEYVVLKNSYEADFKNYATDAQKTNGYENLVELLSGNGYVLIHSNGSLEIYKQY